MIEHLAGVQERQITVIAKDQIFSETGTTREPAAPSILPAQSALQNSQASPSVAGDCKISGNLSRGRVALVLANGAYSGQLAKLVNTYADAKVVTSALEKLGFEVQTCLDLGERQTKEAVIRFGDRISAAGSDNQISSTVTGFFFYSGHGTSSDQDKANYVLPIDATSASAQDIAAFGVPLEKIIHMMYGSGANYMFVVSDACRTSATKGGAKGWEALDWSPANESIYGFSTSPRAAAADNGLYAKILGKALLTKGLKAEVIFDQVQAEVFKRSSGRQKPWWEDGMGQDFFFEK